MKNVKDFISIIIVNWNGKKWLKECLDSLSKQTYKDFEVIFVDNGSTDKSVEYVRKNHPKIIVVQNEKNLGFGPANNIGVSKCSGDVLFFLNNDTDCPENLLEMLLAYKKEKNLNLLGPRVLNKDSKDLLDREYLGMDFLGSPGGPSRKLFYIDGCSLMIGKQDFFDLRQFDEKYFMYSEDIDLSWKAHLRAMKMGICEDTYIKHYGGGSSSETDYKKKTTYIVPVFRRYEVEKNTLRNLLKNYCLINLIWVLPVFFVQNTAESILYLLTGNLAMFKVIWRAIYWNISNFRDTLNERRYVQKNRINSDIEIIQRMDYFPNKIKVISKLGLPKFK